MANFHSVLRGAFFAQDGRSGYFVPPCDQEHFGDDDENTKEKVSFPYRKGDDRGCADDRDPIPGNALRTVFEFGGGPFCSKMRHGIIVAQVNVRGFGGSDRSLMLLRP